jgi:hypothetical protein
VGSRGGDQESEIGGESEIERERERERERDEQIEDPIDGGPTPEEQEATSSYGSSTGGRRCDFRWLEPTSGEVGMIRQFLWSGVGADRS